MPGRHHLFIPGPTTLPDRVLREMHVASIDHRSSAFPGFVRPILADLARLFGTTAGRVAVFPATGTGGWEIALVNTLAPGDRVLLPCAGQFAALWGESAERLGFAVERVDGMTWGDAPSPAAIGERLAADRDHAIRAVLVVHNETATGVTADLPAIRAAIDAAGHPALLMVDGVSSIGSLAYAHDAWGIDVGLTGSQKGLMLPAGLALVACSPKALAAAGGAATRRGYFDLGAMLAANESGYFPYTPSIPMLAGLREALAMLFEEGLERVVARHARHGAGVRAAVAAWDLALCCRDAARVSDTVSTIMTPDGVDAREVIRYAFERRDLSLGAGLGPLAGRAFRIGHLGDNNDGTLLAALALTELALVDAGLPLELGVGVAAAQLRWREGAP